MRCQQRWVLIFCLAALAQAEPAKSRVVVAEKHASELDLKCESYEDGVDWSEVRRQLFEFLLKPSQEHPFLPSLLALGRTQTDCYIGLCCLGYLAMIFMNPEKRLRALVHTLFGSVPLWDQIPLSYWDTIHSRWPIFGLLELVGAQVRHQPEALGAEAASDGCCDRNDSEMESMFREILEKQLSTGSTLPSYTAVRCSKCVEMCQRATLLMKEGPTVRSVGIWVMTFCLFDDISRRHNESRQRLFGKSTAVNVGQIIIGYSFHVTTHIYSCTSISLFSKSHTCAHANSIKCTWLRCITYTCGRTGNQSHSCEFAFDSQVFDREFVPVLLWQSNGLLCISRGLAS